MMKKINIKFLSDEALETVKLNSNKMYEFIKMNPSNNAWISKVLPSNPFVTKQFLIDDFNLMDPKSGNYDDVAYDNAILLYENLKELHRRILSDERFWLWLYFDKFYNHAVLSIPLKSKTTFENHWTFKQGNRRGIFFGTLSRHFFRVERTVDNSLEDKYELTKYIFERPERFRTLSWRTFSNNKTIVLGTIKAQKDFEEQYNNKLPNNFYNLISKRISRFASVNYLDTLSEKEVYDIVYRELDMLTKASDKE